MLLLWLSLAIRVLYAHKVLHESRNPQCHHSQALRLLHTTFEVSEFIRGSRRSKSQSGGIECCSASDPPFHTRRWSG